MLGLELRLGSRIPMSMVLTIVLIWLGLATLVAVVFGRLKAAQKHYGTWTRTRLSELQRRSDS